MADQNHVVVRRRMFVGAVQRPVWQCRRCEATFEANVPAAKVEELPCEDQS